MKQWEGREEALATGLEVTEGGREKTGGQGAITFPQSQTDSDYVS